MEWVPVSGVHFGKVHDLPPWSLFPASGMGTHTQAHSLSGADTDSSCRYTVHLVSARKNALPFADGSYCGHGARSLPPVVLRRNTVSSFCSTGQVPPLPRWDSLPHGMVQETTLPAGYLRYHCITGGDPRSHASAIHMRSLHHQFSLRAHQDTPGGFAECHFSYLTEQILGSCAPAVTVGAHSTGITRYTTSWYLVGGGWSARSPGCVPAHPGGILPPACTPPAQEDVVSQAPHRTRFTTASAGGLPVLPRVLLTMSGPYVHSLVLPTLPLGAALGCTAHFCT